MLQWNWSEKVGYVDYTDRNGKVWNINIYTGNAFMIFIYEYKDENEKAMYQLHSFFADLDHMKNMLGLTKGYDQCFYPENYVFHFTSINNKVKKVLPYLYDKGFEIHITTGGEKI